MYRTSFSSNLVDIEILFVMDASGSLSDRNWDDTLDVAEHIEQAANMDCARTPASEAHMGIMQFAGDACGVPRRPDCSTLPRGPGPGCPHPTQPSCHMGAPASTYDTLSSNGGLDRG